MRFLLALVLIATFTAPLHAQNFNHNAWGLVAAPMTYSLAEGSHYEVNESNSSLDWGLYYTRFFSPGWSGRFEVFSQGRAFNTFAPAANLAPGEEAYFAVDESVVQTDLVLDADRRIDLSGHEARFTVGVGLLMSVVYDQTIAAWSSAVGSGGPAEGDYFKWGWLFESGMTLAIDDDFAVFARFRVQQDEDTFGESQQAEPAYGESNADVVRELFAYGFHVGIESGF